MDRLLEIYNYLICESESIRKLGPKRRQEKLGQQKFENVIALYKDYRLHIKTLHLTKSSDIELTCEAIEETYKKIVNYMQVGTIEIVQKMDNFDLKTASTLIPLMDGRQENIEQIIDGIEMYSNCLKGEESKKLLISFVLKTRLSKTAKLKLNPEYSTIESLLLDIKKYLLTKKSANSLLSQINNLSQNNMSISKYGEKLEELFIGLTITQAGENEKAREILRPLNEQLAIKRFSDGLRNRRLSTIISARNYSALKDAVRAAEDEELASPGSSSQTAVYSYSQGNRNQSYYRYPRYNRGRQFYRGYTPSRGGTYQPISQVKRGHNQPNISRYNYQSNTAPTRNYNQSRYPRNNVRFYRGNSNNNYYRKGNAYVTESEQKEEDLNLAEFFRA